MVKLALDRRIYLDIISWWFNIFFSVQHIFGLGRPSQKAIRKIPIKSFRDFEPQKAMDTVLSHLYPIIIFAELMMICLAISDVF